MVRLIEAPTWLLDALKPDPQVQRSVARHPSAQPHNGVSLKRLDGDGFNPFDWLRENADWQDTLDRHDWSIHSTSGGDIYYTRPDKMVREGKSAVLHEGGPLVVFTTEVPETLEGLGHPTVDGTGFSVSIVEFICAYEFGGNMALLADEITRRWGPVEGGGRSERAASGAPSVQATGDHRLPVAPPEYWLDPRNAHILAAARARRVGPDALDVIMLCLQALLIPPGFVLPPLVGGRAPINMLGCIIGKTGETKTTALSAANDLVGAIPPWVLRLNIGSGEGIGATFLRERMEPNAKGTNVKTGMLERNPDVLAAFFEADEGSALVAQAERHGATVIPILCKAWSGSQLGEANADPTKRRLVAAMSYRMSALVNIQPSNFKDLFNVKNTGTGLTGRFLFAPASDYDIPDEPTAWPGEMDFPRHPNMPVEIGVPEAIRREIDAAIVATHRNASLAGQGEATSHRNQVALRIAAIRALAEDRRSISDDDWTLAKVRTDTSAEGQEILSQHFLQIRSDEEHRADSARALSAVRVESEQERIKTGKAVDRITKVLGEHGPLAPSALSEKMTASLRPFRDEALMIMTSMGKVRLEGERYALTP